MKPSQLIAILIFAISNASGTPVPNSEAAPIASAEPVAVASPTADALTNAKAKVKLLFSRIAEAVPNAFANAKAKAEPSAFPSPQRHLPQPYFDEKPWFEFEEEETKEEEEERKKAHKKPAGFYTRYAYTQYFEYAANWIPPKPNSR